MEKLIELLNERDTTVNGKTGGWCKEHLEYQCHGPRVISKKFGFIKWLVENDKIDREKFGNSETKSSKYSDFELSYDTPREDYVNTLLMELAINDNPITFILGILK